MCLACHLKAESEDAEQHWWLKDVSSLAHRLVKYMLGYG